MTMGGGSVFDRLYKTPTESWKHRVANSGAEHDRSPSPLRSPSRSPEKRKPLPPRRHPPPRSLTRPKPPAFSTPDYKKATDSTKGAGNSQPKKVGRPAASQSTSTSSQKKSVSPAEPEKISTQSAAKELEAVPPGPGNASSNGKPYSSSSNTTSTTVLSPPYATPPRNEVVPELSRPQTPEELLDDLLGDDEEFPSPDLDQQVALQQIDMKILWSSQYDNPPTLKPVSEDLERQILEKYNDSNNYSPNSVAKLIIELLFDRDFDGKKEDRWDVDSASVEQKDETPASFQVEKAATYNHKDIYSVATSKATIVFGEREILIQNYSYYVAG